MSKISGLHDRACQVDKHLIDWHDAISVNCCFAPIDPAFSFFSPLAFVALAWKSPFSLRVQVWQSSQSYIPSNPHPLVLSACLSVMRLFSIGTALYVAALAVTGVAAIDESWSAVDALSELQRQAMEGLKVNPPPSRKRGSAKTCSLLTADRRQDW